VRLDLESDVHAVSRELMGGLQAAMVASTYHLRCFLAGSGQVDLGLEELSRAIRARGGHVVESPLRTPADEPIVRESMRYQFEHHFYPEARSLLADRPDVLRYLERNDFREAAAPAHLSDDDPGRRIVRMLIGTGLPDAP
jgi:hypothetical protein